MVTLIKQIIPPLTKSLTATLKSTLLMLLLALSLPVLAKGITVETERQTVEFGDIITLNVTADFQVITGQLDLTLLEKDFEVLGSQRSNNIQMVNGDFQSSTSWLIQLLPKREGKLTIPPFEFDDIKSSAFELNVTPLQVQHSGTALQPFFLESTVDETNPYIQQQVIYTLRFYHQGRYVDGMLRPPKFEKVILEPLKEQAVYQKQIQGSNYTVYEWIYALYPQSSGEINIEPPMFNGRIQYAGRLKQVKEFAKEITLEVKPEPISFAQQTTNSWLPTKSLTLEQAWKQPNPDQIQVGDTLTQTITMNVQGLKASQLPNLGLPAKTEYKIYPEKPLESEQPSAVGINSVKTFKRSIIPTEAGDLTLPEQVIHWWNTDTDQLEKTVVPAKTFNVTAPIVNPQDPTDCVLPSQALTTTPTDDKTGLNKSVSTIWIGLSVLFGILWITTSVLFVRQKQRLDSLKEAKNRALIESETQTRQKQQASSNIETLCKLPPDALYPALKTWLKEQYQIQHFSELNSPKLQQLIQQLEASLYNQATPEASLSEQLAEALKQFQLDRPKQADLLKSKESKLATLYKR